MTTCNYVVTRREDGGTGWAWVGVVKLVDGRLRPRSGFRLQELPPESLPVLTDAVRAAEEDPVFVRIGRATFRLKHMRVMVLVPA